MNFNKMTFRQMHFRQMHFKQIAFTSLMVAAGLCGFAQASAQTPAPAGGEPARPPLNNGTSSVQPKAPYPGHVEGLFDITYESLRGFRPLKLDLYRQVGARGSRPAVIFLHGGGFAVGSPRLISPVFGEMDRVLARLAARGYVVVGATYRLSGEVHFPGPIEDVKAAVRWLRANAAKYGVDAERVAVWGESAGAYLAEFTGLSCKAAGFEGKGGNLDRSSCVQAVVDWYGPTDLSQLDAQSRADSRIKHNDADSPESKLLGCALSECPKELIREASPMTHVAADAPPFLIMHGDSDTVVPVQQSRMLQDALRAAGVASSLVVVPKVDHVFAGASPAEGQAILDQVFEFLDTTIGKKK